MSDISNCPKCGELAYLPVHECKHLYRVYLDGWEPKDALEIRANDPEDAAEKFVEYNIYNFDDTETVFVDDLEGEISTVLVKAEMVVQITSEKISSETYEVK